MHQMKNLFNKKEPNQKSPPQSNHQYVDKIKTLIRALGLVDNSVSKRFNNYSSSWENPGYIKELMDHLNSMIDESHPKTALAKELHNTLYFYLVNIFIEKVKALPEDDSFKAKWSKSLEQLNKKDEDNFKALLNEIHEKTSDKDLKQYIKKTEFVDQISATQEYDKSAEDTENKVHIKGFGGH